MVELFDIGLPLLLTLAGGALLVMEALAPGAHFMVLGVALLLAGVLGIFFGPLASPLALAVMVVLFGAIAFYGYRELDLYGGKGTAQTSDSASLRGSYGRVTERVTQTGGEVKLEDGGFNPHYQARSLDDPIEEGEEVIVVDPGGGNVITVESVSETGMDDIDRELARAREQSGTESGSESAPDQSVETEVEADVEAETETTDADPDADADPS